jgi:putative dimethyl sulfoxide reductase chaperone
MMLENNRKIIDTPEHLEEVLVGEVLLLGLLARALYEEPNRAWLEELVTGQVFSESPFGADQPEIVRGLEILQQWSRSQAGGMSKQTFDELKMDYTKLFIGLDTLPTAPWESVYFNRERLVFQEQTLQVREWYARFDLQIERLNREPDDHIGLELSFLANLASLALQAIQQDPNSVESLLQAQRTFLTEHLLRWGPAWAKLVKQHAETDFYRGVAHLTHGALLAAADVLQIQMPKEVSL